VEPPEAGGRETDRLRAVQSLFTLVTREIPGDYIDRNQHMNMMYYTPIANEGLRRFFGHLGVDLPALRAGGQSMVVARQVLLYRHEVLQGERVAVHGGLHAFDASRLHYFLYTVSLDHGRIACVDERLGVCIDSQRRRSGAFPAAFLARLEEARQACAATGWQAEPSGAIRIRAA
jgi:acyl-CoA thioesterase FadM